MCCSGLLQMPRNIRSNVFHKTEAEAALSSASVLHRL